MERSRFFIEKRLCCAVLKETRGLEDLFFRQHSR
jgi:hypothetical protein